MDAQAVLADLDARNQIHNLHARWCRGVDRCDREYILSVFHPDAWDDHGSFSGTPEQIADIIINLHQTAFLWTAHYVMNEYVQIKGDSAVGEAHVQGAFRFQRDGKLFDMTGNGRYLDRYERRNGIWKIIYRTATADWNRIDPVDELPEGELVKKLTRGTRSTDDPSYKFIGPPV